MRKPRARFEFGVLDGKLFAAGGSSGQLELRKFEIYDPKTKLWTPKSDLPTERPSSGEFLIVFLLLEI